MRTTFRYHHEGAVVDVEHDASVPIQIGAEIEVVHDRGDAVKMTASAETWELQRAGAKLRRVVWLQEAKRAADHKADR